MTTHYFRDGGQEYRNIVGTLVGTGQSQKKVIILAHYDTVPVSPGANDNASGVAALLELARVLNSLRFQKSILFIGVNLEERMAHDDKASPLFMGSRALAQYAEEEQWAIRNHRPLFSSNQWLASALVLRDAKMVCSSP